MKTIFITGATGKIGGLLVSNLKKKGYSIRALLHDKSPDNENEGFCGIRGDLLRPDSYAFALEGVTAVIHAAAITHTNKISSYYRVNSYGTLLLSKLCKRYGVKRFIFVSTRAISAEGGHYSYSKRIAEKYVQESGLEWVVLRLGEVYGAGGKEGIDMVWNNINRLPVIPIIGNGRNSVMPIHVNDVVFSIMQALEREHSKGRIYTIAGPEVLTYNELVDKLLAVSSMRKMKVHVPFALVKTAVNLSALVTRRGFLVKDQFSRLTCEKSNDISLARAELGLAPLKIEDAISLRMA